MGADRKRTLWRGGALKVCDVRLFEDGGELGGTLVSDVVVLQTVSEEQSGDGERSGVSRNADAKSKTRELVRATGGLLERLQRRVALEALRESGCSFWTDLVAP